MFTLRVRVETHADPAYISLHFNRVVSEIGTEDFFIPLDPIHESRITSLGETGATLVRRLNDIIALTRATFIGQIQLDLRTGELFEWADVLPQVFDALRAAFNAKKLDVDYKRPLHAGFVPPATVDLSGLPGFDEPTDPE
jgi:hypothetical protein